MSEKKKSTAETKAELDDVPAVVAQEDAADANEDNEDRVVAGETHGPLPPQPGDPDYKKPELWGRGRAASAETTEPAGPRLGQKHKAPATEA